MSRAEKYDDRTMTRAIRKHERDRRQYFKESGEEDPLLMERTRADRRGQGIGQNTVVESGQPFYREVDNGARFGVRYTIPQYNNPRDMNTFGSVTEQMSDDISEYINRRNDRRPEEKEEKVKNVNLRTSSGGNRTKNTRTPSGKQFFLKEPLQNLAQGIGERWRGFKEKCRRDPSCRSKGAWTN